MGECTRVSGQKRKVYRVKEVTNLDPNSEAETQMLALTGPSHVNTTVPEATGDGSVCGVSESHKKMKMNTPTEIGRAHV